MTNYSRYHTSLSFKGRTIVQDLWGDFLAVILFFYTLNWLNCAVPISIAVVLIFILKYIKNRCTTTSWQAIFVTTFFVVYGLCTWNINGENRIILTSQCIIFFLLGRNIGRLKLTNNYFKIISGAAFGFVLRAVLDSLTSHLTVDRRLTDLNDGYLIPVTQVVAWLIIFLALIPWIAFIFKKFNLFNKVFYSAIIILSTGVAIYLSSRTVIFALLFSLAYIIVMAIRDKKYKILGAIVIVILLIFIVWNFNFLGMKDLLLNSDLASRFVKEGVTTPRTKRWAYLIQHWKEYPFGGRHFYNYFDAQLHNVFFDLFDEAGIFVELLFLLIYLKLIIELIKIFINRNKFGEDISVGLLSWFIIVSFLLFTEPVWDYGRYMFMAMVFMMIGITDGIFCYGINDFGQEE
jgi:hypothetical protein